MGEPKKSETLEEIFQRVADSQTPEEIVAQLNRDATENYLSDAMRAAAKVVHAELLKRLETAPDEHTRLAVARAARNHFHQMTAEHTRKQAEEARKGWQPWRRDFDDWVAAGKPVDQRPSTDCFPAVSVRQSAEQQTENPDEEL